MGVDCFTYDNATAEVRPNVGVLDQEILDGGAIGLGKKARIALGVQNIFGVVQTRHGVVPAIKDTPKGIVLVTKGKMLNRTRDDGVHVIVIEVNIVIEVHVPLRRVALARKRDARQEVSLVFDVKFLRALRHILGMRCRRQRHNAAKGNRHDGDQPAEHAPVHVLDLHGLVRLRPAHNVEHVEDGIVCLLVFGLHGLNVDIEPE